MIPDWILAWLWEHLPHDSNEYSRCNQKIYLDMRCSLPQHDGMYHAVYDENGHVSIWGPQRGGGLSEYFNTDWWELPNTRIIHSVKELDKLPEASRIVTGCKSYRTEYTKHDGLWISHEDSSSSMSQEIWMPAFVYE